MQVDVKKWLWVDLEMTGLNPDDDVIIEVAAIVTDSEFNELASWETVVKQPQEQLEKMKLRTWREIDNETGDVETVGTVYDMHVQSGLLERLDSGISDEQADQQFADFIDAHFEGAARLAGNTVHQDRRFIRQYWPKTDAKLHYRILDVTSFKEVLRDRGIEYEKEKAHNAMDDIRGSIEELKFYLQHVNRDS